MPQLGAARTKLDDGVWQEKVAEWISEADILAMIAGTTEWIRWELDETIKQGGVERLLILVPPPTLPSQPAQLQERWNNVRQPFEDTIWAVALEEIDPSETLLVQLETDGQVTAFRSTGRMVRDYQLAITLGLYRRHCSTAD